VADAQHITENAARQRLFRALGKMRNYLKRKNLPLSDDSLGAALAWPIWHEAPANLASRILPALHAPSTAAGSLSIAQSTLKTIRIITGLKTAAITGALLAAAVLGGTAAVRLAMSPPLPNQTASAPQAQVARPQATTSVPVIPVDQPVPAQPPPPAAQPVVLTAPFQAIAIQDGKPQVLVDGTWYELVAVNTVPVDRLIAAEGGMDRLRYVGTNIQHALGRLRHPAGPTVTLSVKDPATGDAKLLKDVPMTAANRDDILIYERNHGLEVAVDLAHSLPYRAIRWIDHTPQVQIGTTWYELQAINDVPVTDIITFLQNAGPTPNGDSAFFRSVRYRKIFSPLILQNMGRDLTPKVDLTVKDLDSGKVATLTGVAMTEANLVASHAYDRSQPAVKLGADGNGFERLSPFQAVQWPDDGVQVQVNGHTYMLQAINDISAIDILAYAYCLLPVNRSNAYEALQQHFETDLVEILTRMNHKPQGTVKLTVHDPSTDRDVTLDNVPMTAENRQALIQARATAPP